MSQSHPHEAVRATLLDASRRISAARIDISTQNSWNGFRVLASYSLDLDLRTEGRYVLLDYSRSRFEISESATNVGSIRDLGIELGDRILCVDLAGSPRPATSVRVETEIDWRPDAWNRGRNPYFVASTSLPTVLHRDTELRSTQTVFFVDAAVQSEFAVASIQLDPADWDPLSHPQLDVVLLPEAVISKGEGGDVLFGGELAQALDERIRTKLASELHRNLDFLRQELGMTPSVRLGLYDDSNPKELPLTSRSLLVERPSYLGFTGDLRFLGGQGIAKLAAIWWGCGVKVSGFLGLGISYAVGQALALRAMDVRRTRARFDAIKRVTDKRASTELTDATRDATRALKLSGELGLALYHGLKDRASVRGELRAMTAEYWGEEVSPEPILKRLAGVGITPPNGLHGLK